MQVGFTSTPLKAFDGPQGWRWPGMVWARKGQLCPGVGAGGREPVGVPVCPAAPRPLPHPRYQTWRHIPQVSKLCINWLRLVLTLVTRESWKFHLKENIWVPFPATTCKLIKWKTSPRKKIEHTSSQSHNFSLNIWGNFQGPKMRVRTRGVRKAGSQLCGPCQLQ